MEMVPDEFIANLYHELRDYTMVGISKFSDTLKLASTVKQIEGDIVECGVWRGGMLAGLRRCLGENRTYFAYDSFEGLPPAEAIDGAAAINWQKNTEGPAFYNNCAAEKEWIVRLFEDKPELLKVVPGWYKDSLLLEKNLPKRIAVLRLDCDWFESTITALRFLYPRVTPGGLIIIDDYEDWVGCRRAIHTYFNLVNVTVQVLNRNSTFYFFKSEN